MEDVAIGLSVDQHARAPIPLTAEKLCQTYAGRVYKFAQLISIDSTNAEDLAQDALERAIRGLKTFNPAKGEIEGWLWRIADVGTACSHKREAARRNPNERHARRWIN